MKYVAVLFCIVLLLSDLVCAHAQSFDVVGSVVSQEGKPLHNVTVKTKVERTETVSDDKGGFKIRLAYQDSLIFSCVGYRSESYWINRSHTDLTIMLTPLENEIKTVEINTGYQRLKPNEVNGSVESIGKEQLAKQVDPNILNRINGIANGVMFQLGRENNNPQNKTGITIRGYGTINGPLDPLIVLDNFVYEGNIENINPDDVENVTILKDAEATSIYGARGGNGVIVITTKKGKFGQGIQVSANANLRVSAVPDLDVLPWMSNADYIAMEEKLYADGFFDGDVNSYRAPPITPIVDALVRKDEGLLSEEEYQSYKKFLSQGDFRSQYTEAFYRPARTNQYHVGLSGGSDQTSWSVSAGHNRDRGNTGNSSKKYNLRANNTMRFGDRVEVSLNGLFTNQQTNTQDVPSYQSLATVGTRQLVPYISLYDESGRPLPFDRYYSSNLMDTVGKGRLKDWHYYPLSDGQYTDNTSRIQDILGNVALRLKLFDGVNLQTDYQLQDQQTSGHRHHMSGSFYVRNLVNRFASINETTGEVTYNVPDGDILARSVAKQSSQAFRSQLNVERRIRNRHHVRGFIGVEAREVRSEASSWTHYGYKKDPLEYQQVDQVGVYRTWPLGSTASIGGSTYMDPTVINRFVSLYGNVHYLFSDRYAVSGSMRKDGSNIYGVSTNDKWKPLWSVGFGYEMSKESFFKGLPFSRFKLKGTWGYSGNVDLSRSALPVASYGNNPENVGGLPLARIGTLNNPSLRWEEVRQLNVGAEFTLRDVPLSGSVEYYTKSGSDLYGPSDYDYTTWGTLETIVKNVADMKGNGVDVKLRYRVNREQFRSETGLIYNYNMSKTSKYYDNATFSSLYRLVSSNGTRITPLEDYPLYALAGFVWKGLDDSGNPQGWMDGAPTTDYTTLINGVMDGEGNMESVRFVGSAIPVHFGSLFQDFSYRNFNLSFNIMYKFGYFFKRNSIMYSAIINQGIGHKDFEKRWQKAGDITDVPSFEYPLTTPDRDNFYGGSEIHILKGDHIRLQFVNLGYTFPAQGRSSLFKNISAVLNVSNVGILWRANKAGIDPDYPDTVRPPRSTSLGVRMNF